MNKGALWNTIQRSPSAGVALPVSGHRSPQPWQDRQRFMLHALRAWMERYGVPLALYVDAAIN
jgi:hypothetical protein